MWIVKLLSEYELQALRKFNKAYLLRGIRRVGRVRVYMKGVAVARGRLELVGTLVVDWGEYIVRMVDGGAEPLEDFLELSGYPSVEKWISVFRSSFGYSTRAKLYLLEVSDWIKL